MITNTIPGIDIFRTANRYGVEHKGHRHGWRIIGWVGTSEAAWNWCRRLQAANQGEWRVMHPPMNGGRNA